MTWWLAGSWLTAAALALACMAVARRLREQRRCMAAVLASLECSNERALAYARELEKQALEDQLTGLHNRRFMDADLPRELERTRRFGRELTLAMLDVDGFKQINDTYSHQVGDRVLAEVGRILVRACRGMDGIVRYGGDEFVLYFPETSISSGRAICGRVLKRVGAYDWSRIAPDLAVTLSIGLACTQGAEDARELLEAADARLRSAKQAGKNRLYAEDALVSVA